VVLESVVPAELTTSCRLRVDPLARPATDFAIESERDHPSGRGVLGLPHDEVVAALRRNPEVLAGVLVETLAR